MSESEKLVVCEMQKNPYVKTDELVVLTGLSMPTISRAIKSLREKQIISREGSKKTGMWIVN